MKKFYLKIWLLAFITAFAAIPAAAKVSVDHLQIQEEKDLAISCDSGDGKYSACTKLVEILSKKCDDGDYESCGAVGMIFMDLGQYEFSSAPLIKACEANIMSYCSYLAISDILFTGNLERAAKVFDKICKQGISEDKRLACSIRKEIEDCSKDAKCDPLMKAKETIKGTITMRKILSLALLLSMPLLAKNDIDIDISAAINDTNLKKLANKCDWNKGDYEACSILKDTLSAKCDEKNFESCGALGILLIYLRRDEDATKALNKACDAGLLNFCLNAGMHDLYYTGNIKRAFVNLKKVCDAAIEPSKKKLACKMSYGLKPCLNDNECNPVKKAKELLDQD